MGQILKRVLQPPDLTENSMFLWGPRRTGKSFWIKNQLKYDFHHIDLLKSDVFAEYASKPALLRERFSEDKLTDNVKLIVIDEIQKCPELLDEVHWMIENTQKKFLLTGSSARKLRKYHSNLLAGRAIRREMRPICFPEYQIEDLERVFVTGLLPVHLLSNSPIELIRSYVADYLKEEIAQESITRNLQAFSDFLRVSAVTNSELLNFTNISREVGVSAKVVKSYFEILEDTLLGFRLTPWRKSQKRRSVETEKFYFFDVGISNFLAKRTPKLGTPEFGKSFEHYIFMELKAYQAYKNLDLEINFWRTSNGQEVDFIVNQDALAIEVKSGNRTHETDLKGLTLIAEERTFKERILVSQDELPKIFNDKYGKILVLPWRNFLERLWAGEL